MLLALSWGLGAQSNAGSTTHSPNWVQRGPQAPSNSCSDRDAHSRMDKPGAHPTTLPPSPRTAWSGLELLIPLAPLFPRRDGWGEVGNCGGVVMQQLLMGRETSLPRVLRAEHSCSSPHWAPPSPKPAASEPARQKPVCFGVVRAT